MSDPTVQRARAIESELRAAIRDGWRTTLLFDAAEVIAGLLADPTTPTLTPEQADVIEKAVEWRTRIVVVLPRNYELSPAAQLIAAVDRLAAATEDTP